jgi:hypothetical protein
MTMVSQGVPRRFRSRTEPAMAGSRVAVQTVYFAFHTKGKPLHIRHNDRTICVSKADVGWRQI